MTDETESVVRKGSIGFTIVEEGTEKLKDGTEVPIFKGRPNDPDAHRRLMDALKRKYKISE